MIATLRKSLDNTLYCFVKSDERRTKCSNLIYERTAIEHSLILCYHMYWKPQNTPRVKNKALS